MSNQRFEKLLLLTAVLSLFVTFVYLVAHERKVNSPHDWWAVYFLNPKDETNYDFAISNYTDKESFEYSFQTQNLKPRRTALSVPAGKTVLVEVKEKPLDGRITVYLGKEKKVLKK